MIRALWPEPGALPRHSANIALSLAVPAALLTPHAAKSARPFFRQFPKLWPVCAKGR